MDAPVYAKPTISDEGFFRKYRHRLAHAAIVTSLGSLIYAVLTAIIGNAIIDNSFVDEHYKTRIERKSDDAKEDPQTIRIPTDQIEPYFRPIIKAIEFPWRKMGYVMPDHYREIRARAFQIAAIDENNPSHDKRRFELYRALGFAVLREGDGSRGIYIPFKVWRDFIEANSSFRNPEWNQLAEPDSKRGSKYEGTLNGKVFYKTDSRSQGGNEDGVVDNLEWGRALKVMGYTTVDKLVDEIIERVKANGPQLKQQLTQTIRNVKKNDRLVADFDTMPPIRTLEEYLNKN